jgi:hypothetical protein
MNLNNIQEAFNPSVLGADDFLAYGNADHFDTLVTFLTTISTSNLEVLYLVKDRKAWSLRLETGGYKTFEPVGFRFELPKTAIAGTQDLNIEIDNTDRRIMEFIKTVKDTRVPISVIYRPYLSSDVTQPQWNPPIKLTLRKVSVTAQVVSGQASFLDVGRKAFPSKNYTRKEFTNLGE